MVAKSAILLSLSVMVLATMALAKKDRNGFKKYQQTMANGAEDMDRELREDDDPRRRHVHRALMPAGSLGKLAFLQSAQKNGVDPLELLRTTLTSEAMKPLLENVEIQHRLLEALPHLGALPGFKHITGRRLSDEQTMAGFAEGIANLLETGGTLNANIKDPAHVFGATKKVTDSKDPEIQNLLRLAQANDTDATRTIQSMVANEILPGVDTRKLEEVRDNLSFDTVLGIPELARFIDQDSYISNLIRGGKK